MVLLVFYPVALLALVTAIIYNNNLFNPTKEQPFCDKFGTTLIIAENCKPCPYRCRGGKLIACPKGSYLYENSCNRDKIFHAKLAILKHELEKMILADKRSFSVEDLKNSLHEDEEIFLVALDELQQSLNFQVIDGYISFPKNDDSSSGKMQSSSQIIFFAILSIILIILIRRRRYSFSSAADKKPDYSTLNRLMSLNNPQEIEASRAVKLCLCCSEKQASEALLKCGHLVACLDCLQIFEKHMETSGDRRCPFCRAVSVGWIHIW